MFAESVLTTETRVGSFQRCGELVLTVQSVWKARRVKFVIRYASWWIVEAI